MSLDQISSLPPEQQEAILNGPALPPPPGVVPNFANPPNQNAIAHATLAISLTLTTIASLIRFCARVFVIKATRLEDYLAVAAFGTYVGYIYLNYWLILHFGFFVHQWDVRVKDVSKIFYEIYIGGSLYAVTVGLVKVAILREWTRIFVPWPTRNAFWWTCQVLIVANASYYIAGLFVGNLACIPRQKIWDKTIPGGKCIDNRLSDLIASTVNLLSDLLILLLPQRVIWKLNLPRKQKLGASFIFTLGILTVVSAAFRFYYTVSHWFRDGDTVYAVSAVTLWAVAEMTCMFLVLEVPAAPKVFGQNGLTAQIATSLRSWTNLSPKRSIESLDMEDPYNYKKQWTREV
ncbi:hypothetical protein F5Y07DRAFT_389242 [Xylaria sp. FL0933]|nr:hypothetical protein F5Y07DRAFT_389242 [Xylaria sp. FL0933]